MIKHLQIKNFKSLDDVSLNNLKRVNFIAGKNGRGKTSVLDAIFISNDLISPDCLLKPIVFRGGAPILNENDIWYSYFNSYEPDKKIHITISNEDGGKYETTFDVERRKNKSSENINVITTESYEKNKMSLTSSDSNHTLNIRLKNVTNRKKEALLLHVEQTINGAQITAKLTRHGNENFSVPTTYITTSNKLNFANTISVIGELIKRKDKARLLEDISIINNKIVNIELVFSGDQPEILVDIGEKRLVDLSSLGEGVSKLLTIFAISFFTRNGIILIDEIENGIHYSLMPKIISTLVELSHENNNQIFITTHSFDVINTIGEMVRSEKITESDISFTRIGYSDVKRKTISTTFSMDEVKLSTDENWEIR
ncbi:AAA family ATPase [Atlantibacter hermannii]|uniref:AAA family ATPase n=1 Tax=Atlantibacter hermannii TaxID=565 RepID=UPI0028A269D0|nr:AAA family ATPase [Atlantibacter hermannii]